MKCKFASIKMGDRLDFGISSGHCSYCEHKNERHCVGVYGGHGKLDSGQYAGRIVDIIYTDGVFKCPGCGFVSAHVLFFCDDDSGLICVTEEFAQLEIPVENEQMSGWDKNKIWFVE